jgi:hypothetical protein
VTLARRSLFVEVRPCATSRSRLLLSACGAGVTATSTETCPRHPWGERARRRRRRSLARSDGDRRATGVLSVAEVHQRLELTDPIRVAPEHEAGLEALLRHGRRSSSSRGDLRVRERLICEFGQRRSRPRAKRGAERRYRWVRRHALERRQSLIAADCEGSRMVGALVHLDVGAVLALHDRRRRRPGHDATARMARRPVAASSAMSVVAIGGPRSSLAGGCQRSPKWRRAPRRDSEEAYDRIASGPGPDLPA